MVYILTIYISFCQFQSGISNVDLVAFFFNWFNNNQPKVEKKRLLQFYWVWSSSIWLKSKLMHFLYVINNGRENSYPKVIFSASLYISLEIVFTCWFQLQHVMFFFPLSVCVNTWIHHVCPLSLSLMCGISREKTLLRGWTSSS